MTVDDDPIAVQVKEMIARNVGRIASELKLEHRLYHDFGIYGDDVDEFLPEYVERFGIDISGFDFDRYFPPEVSFVPQFIRKWFKQPVYEPVTIADLIEIAKRKKWVVETTDNTGLTD